MSADVTAIRLGRRLPGASSNLPGRQDLDTDPEAYPPARVSPAPSLCGLAPGGVCRAADVTAGAVRSYRTVSPLPFTPSCSLAHLRGGVGWGKRRSVLCGTFPGLAPAGCYPAPFVHGARTFLPGIPLPDPPPLAGEGRVGAGAAVRPTDRGMDGDVGGRRQGRQDHGEICTMAVRARAAMLRGRPRVAMSSCNVLRVDGSAKPSMRSGRKWR